jgi:deoxyribose-phosphate aldolase
MKIDFAITHTDRNEAEIKDLLSKLSVFKQYVNSITCSYYYLKLLTSFIQETDISLGCVVDYPLGISDLKSRKLAVEQAHKAGAMIIDITMPQNLVANRKYDKIREDVKVMSDYCNENGLTLRYILEYRVFDHQCLKKLCEIFDSFNMRYVFPSSSYFLDDLSDNLIASVFLHENSKDINIYCTGNAWTDKHFNIIEKTGLYGIRVSSLPSLKILANILGEKNNNY